MSVTAPTGGDLFSLRVYKKIDIAADQVWANTYEMRANTGVTYDDLVDAADTLVAFEKIFHQDTTFFDRVVVSTYVEDGAPYNPDSFISLPQSGAGAVASPVAAETLPLQVVLFVRRDVASGRTGKIFYRGCLEEDDVQGRFGTISLTSPSTIATRISGALTTSGLDEYLAGGTAPLRLLMVSGAGGTSQRDISGLTPVGARIVKYNNRYFDRA